MQDRLAGKVAIVTGGARGMGAAHAKRMIELGAKVAITDLREDLGNALAKSLGENAMFVQHDVTKEADWKRVVAAVVAKFGDVNVLVNNAGIAGATSVADLELAEYERFMAINATSAFLGMREVAPSMKRAGGGSIVNVSSIAGLFGTNSAFAYIASKFAMTGMSKSAAIDLAPDKIRVNSVHPGHIDTPMSDELKSDDPYHIKFFNEYLAKVPMQRAGRGDELTGLVVFLASDESSFCTGGQFTADGGTTCAA